MSAHFKAYVVVLIISLGIFVLMRKPFADAIGGRTYGRWRNLWLAYTTLAFFTPNYWGFLLLSGITIYFLALQEKEKPAVYLLLLTALPTAGLSIPGFAGIARFIDTSPQLVLAAIFLIPALLSTKRMRKIDKSIGAPDLFFLMWLLLTIAMSVRSPSFTHTLRQAIEAFLSIAPIYYVISRWPRTLGDVRVLLAAFLLPIVVFSALSILEVARNWHFHNSIATSWFGHMPFGYTMREGYLRASAATLNPIVWGYLCVASGGFALALFNEKFLSLYKWLGFGLIAGGLLASLSRGPWVGMVVVVGVFVCTGPKKISRLTQLTVGAVIAGATSLATPFGERVIDLLPGIGTAGADTISYRQQLLETSWGVILENPFFGSNTFLNNENLQHLRQGQGIIDIVNTYLQIGLSYGFVGLTIFCGFFASVLLALRGAMKSAAKYDPTLALYCRGVLASLSGILVTIFTTAHEGQIAHVYWAAGAIGVALARIERVERAKHTGAAQTAKSEKADAGTEVGDLYREA